MTTALIAIILFSLTLPGGIASSQDITNTSQSADQILSQLSRTQDEVRLSALISLRSFLPIGDEAVRERVVANVAGVLRSDPSAVVRAAAAGVLENLENNMDTPGAAAALSGALIREKEANVRKAIAYALGRQSGSTQTLVALLKDKKAEVRGAAAYSLAERNDPDSASPLIEYLKKRNKDEDAFGRSQAILALGNLGVKEARDILIRALTKDKSEIVLCQAAAALGKIAEKDDQITHELLRKTTLDRNPYLAAEAEKALQLISLR